MTNRTLFSAGLLAAAACLCLASAADAQPISRWRFDATNAWLNTTFTSTGQPPTNNFLAADALPDGNDPNGPGHTFEIVQWGTPAENSPSRSFLAVETQHGADTLFTNSPTGIPGATVFHGNYRQSSTGEAWLATTTVAANITITPLAPDGTPLGFPLGPLQQTFFIEFTETRDTDLTDDCQGAPWPGGTTPCPDRFSVDLSNAFFSFAFDDYLYTFRLLLDLENSSNIERLTVSGPTATVWTGENALSILATRILVTAVPIPEPAAGSLLLTGLAALGAGLSRPRRTRRP